MILGNLSTSVFAAEGPPPDSDQIQVEWWAIPKTGDPFVLHEVIDFDLSDIAGSRGAISISVPIGSTTHDQLYAYTVTADTDLEVEIRLYGGQSRALRGFLQEADGDDVAETGARKWSGCLVAGLVYESRVVPNPADEKGEWHFAGKNAAQVVATLVLAAKARGELSGVTIATFNTAMDSLGNSWVGYSSNIVIPPGKSLGEILDDFVERGLSEWDVTGARELLLFVPGARGTDRTVGPDPVVLHRGRDLTDAPRKWSVRDAVTDILVAGKDGLYQTAVDPSAQARRGRKIVGYASDGEVTDAAALQAYAQNRLSTLSPGEVELSHGLVVNGTGPQPFLDIAVGDWVWSDTGAPSGPEKLRVQQVSISRSGDQLEAVAVVGTLTMSAVVMLARRLARLENGTTVVGTSVDPTGPGAGEDTTPPAAPTGLVGSSIAYQDTATGETLARVDVAWEPVTTDADGATTAIDQAAQLILDRMQSGADVDETTWLWPGCPAVVTDKADDLKALYTAAGATDPKAWLQGYLNTTVGDPVVTDDVAGYRVRYAYVGRNQIGGIPSSDPFLDDDVLAYITATDDTGTTATTFAWGGVGAGADVRVQVAAFDRSGNQSVWSAPLVFTTASDNLPPAVTSTPTMEVLFSGARIFWDGLTATGIPARTAAPDFDHIEVHLSPVLDFTPDDTTYQDTLRDTGVWTVQGLTYGVGYYARFVAVDTAGNRAAPSASGGPVTPGKLVNIDIGPDAVSRVQIIDGEIVTAKIADLAVNDAKIASLSVGKLAAGIMTADVIIGGSFMTGQTGQRMRIDSTGWQGYNSLNQVFAKLDISNQTMLMTGIYQSGLSGERINILPDGTFRFYPAAGTNYSQIANFGNDVVWRGPLDPNGRSGRFNVNVTGCGMNFSSESEISRLRSEVVLFDRRVYTTAPNIFFRVDQRFSPVSGYPGFRAATFACTSTNGIDILGGSAVHYKMGDSGSGGWANNGGGVKFEGGYVLICDGNLNGFGPIKSSSYENGSSREIKTDIEVLTRPLDVVCKVRPVSFRYIDGYDTSGDRRVGLIVEEVAPHAPVLVHGADRPAKDRTLDAMGVAAMAWGAVGDCADDIDELRARVEELESRLAS